MYQADDQRYEAMTYVPSGRSGLKLPRIALGLWHNFGATSEMENMKELCRMAVLSGTSAASSPRISARIATSS